MGKVIVTGIRPEDDVYIMYDLQWVEHDGLTVHSVLHPTSPSLQVRKGHDRLTCGAIRQGGGAWIELKKEPMRAVTCLGCIAAGGTPK